MALWRQTISIKSQYKLQSFQLFQIILEIQYERIVWKHFNKFPFHVALLLQLLVQGHKSITYVLKSIWVMSFRLKTNKFFLIRTKSEEKKKVYVLVVCTYTAFCHRIESLPMAQPSHLDSVSWHHFWVWSPTFSRLPIR